MAKIIIKLENGAYNYYEDDKLVKSNLPTRKVTRKDKDGNVTATVYDIVLPKNDYGKGTISSTRFADGVTEYDLANCTVRTRSSAGKKSEPQKPAIDPKDHYTEEEAARAEALQKELDELNATVIARAEREQAIKALEEQAMGLTIEQLKALIAKKEEAKA